MSRSGQLNIILGFTIIFIAASAGSFIAQDMTRSFIQEKDHLQSWQMTLLTSAHGHTNLFGFLHILFGLTTPYSALNDRFKIFQTLGLLSGSVAMSIGMYFSAHVGPKEDLTLLNVCIGTGLSLALVSILVHIIGLTLKIKR